MMNSEWIDTETRAILCDGHRKYTLSATEGFSLLLLQTGTDSGRIRYVISEFGKCGRPNTTSFPFVLRQDLSLDDAIAGQFALACCDCIAAFVLDEVVAALDRPGCAQLYSEITASPEFDAMEVELVSVPSNYLGRKFLWQFLGYSVGVRLPLRRTMFRKKARLMRHCAVTAGAVVHIDD